MDTFRELVAAVLIDSETGSALGLPAEVADGDGDDSTNLLTAATGFEQKVARFTNEAWNQIQQDQENWLWMQEEFTADLRTGVARYNPRVTDLADATRLSFTPTGGVDTISMGDNGFRAWHTENRWYITDITQGLVRGAELPEVGYQRWRGRQQSAVPAQRPDYYAVHPMLDLLVTPTPDRAYRITGEHQTGVQSFTRGDETPRGLPSEYHDLIKWKAIMMLDAADESIATVDFATKQYAIHFNNLKRLYLPKTTLTPAIGADGYDDYRAATVQEFYSR